MPKSLQAGILFCCFFLLQLVVNQANCQTNLIQGRLIDTISRKGISYAQIYNESSKTYSISDSVGNFKLKGRLNDTIAILTLGYYGKKWIVPAYSHNLIMLNPQLYEIEPVVINAPGTYKQFKKAFLEAKTDTVMRIDGFPRYIPRLIPELQDTNIIFSTAFAYAHPIAYYYLMYSKEEKSKRKVLYLKQEQKEQVIIEQKFNRDLVSRLTGLQGDELTDFIAFCNFTHQFLFEASDYEIVEVLSNKYKEYKNPKNTP